MENFNQKWATPLDFQKFFVKNIQKNSLKSFGDSFLFDKVYVRFDYTTFLHFSSTFGNNIEQARAIAQTIVIIIKALFKP